MADGLCMEIARPGHRQNLTAIGVTAIVALGQLLCLDIEPIFRFGMMLLSLKLANLLLLRFLSAILIFGKKSLSPLSLEGTCIQLYC